MSWETFGISVASYLLPILGMVLTAFAGYGLQLLAKKLKINVDLAQDSAIRLALRSAIGGAEEFAARKLKLDHNKGITGAEKAQWVFDRVTQQFPNLFNVDLHKMMDEELATMTGVGATGDRVVGQDPAPNGIPPIPANVEIER